MIIGKFAAKALPDEQPVKRDPLLEGHIFMDAESGRIIVIGEKSIDLVYKCALALNAVLMEYDRPTAMAALQNVIGVASCNDHKTTTITQCVDEWRVFSRGVESVIREMFGAVRHAGKQ